MKASEYFFKMAVKDNENWLLIFTKKHWNKFKTIPDENTEDVQKILPDGFKSGDGCIFDYYDQEGNLNLEEGRRILVKLGFKELADVVLSW